MSGERTAGAAAGGPLRVVLLDIEGTTSSIDFVHRTLFPFARERLVAWVAAHAEEARVREALDAVWATLALEACAGRADGMSGVRALPSGAGADAAGPSAAAHAATAADAPALAALLRWIDEDRKHPALKRLQGWIWDEGFRDGTLRGHVYDEVPATLRRWRAQGLRLAIYSSGSVDAQKALFGHTNAGDLRPLFEAHFDTAVGAKREVGSYAEVARRLAIPAPEVLFLSDVVAELDAARAAGMRTTQVVRPGTVAGTGHPAVATLEGAVGLPGLDLQSR